MGKILSLLFCVDKTFPISDILNYTFNNSVINVSSFPLGEKSAVDDSCTQKLTFIRMKNISARNKTNKSRGSRKNTQTHIPFVSVFVCVCGLEFLAKFSFNFLSTTFVVNLIKVKQ